MALFDLLKNQVTSQMKREASKAVNSAAQSASQAIAKGRNHTESFTFASLPTNLAQLQALPEASLDSAFKTTALCVAVLCNLEKDANATWEMLDYLKGPEDVNEREKSLVTVEVRGNKVVQQRIKNNMDTTPEQKRFLKKWEKEILCKNN